MLTPQSRSPDLAPVTQAVGTKRRFCWALRVPGEEKLFPDPL